MKSKIGLIICIVLFAALLGVVGMLYNNLSAENEVNNMSVQSTQTPQTSKAPDFTVIDDAGNSVSLSDFAGKPVVLNFWASWCTPCKNEMPHFDEMFKKYGDSVQFMVVNLTDGGRETVEKARAYVEEQGYSFPLFYDTNIDAARKYNTTSIPVTYFIDADGNATARANGSITAATLEKGIEMILQ